MKSAPVAISVALALAGCGKEIGDECVISTDCDPNGQRFCDTSQVPGGYCTIQGCDYNTCPEDSACIRFFTGGFDNHTCNHLTEDDTPEDPTVHNDCNLDELCSLRDLCVPSSSESRYCMATCGDDGDCRDGYECRNLNLMKQHGGEPVLAPEVNIDESNVKFCAVKPAI